MNAILHGEGLLTHRKMSESVILPAGLENLLACYLEHCSEAGLHFSTIHGYEKRCHMFLYFMADDGVIDSNGITTACVSKACLRLPSTTPQFVHFYVFYPKPITQIETTLSLSRIKNVLSHLQ